MTERYGDWEPVIGLEVHVQLLTRTKLFCACEPRFGDAPNTHTCPVCLALPGALPVMNAHALDLAITAGLALDCAIPPESVFSRKNYFYPDLPKGYQISQYELPVCGRGRLCFDTPNGPCEVRILRAHLEEDAGKTIHGVESVVDLNRAGTPLIEVVSEPDLRSPHDAAEYLRRLRDRLMFVGVNDGNLEQGSFRCDANVSVRRRGTTKLGTRTEIKNVNSFRFVAEAIEYEIHRQIRLLEQGESIRQQTRGYNADKGETYTLRDKEGDTGYRYFPDPDLPPLRVTADHVATIRARMPELPEARRSRYTLEWQIPANAAEVLTSHPRIAGFFESTVAAGAEAIRAANFVQAEVLRDTRMEGLDAYFPVQAEQLAGLLRAVDDGRISGKQAKEVYGELVAANEARAAQSVSNTSPWQTADAIIAEKGMVKLSDSAALASAAARVVAANPKQAAEFRAGKDKLIGFFVGQLMKETKGSADPAMAQQIMLAALAGDQPQGAE